MTKQMKDIINILCYIGIFILSLFILLPPMLRFFLPNSNNYDNTMTLQLLTCTKTDEYNTKKVVATHYKNNIVQKIDISYSNVTDQSYIEEKDYYNLSGVVVNDNKDKINIVITPNQNNKNRLNPLFKNINEQKSIYEDGDYNYKCTITSE